MSTKIKNPQCTYVCSTGDITVTTSTDSTDNRTSTTTNSGISSNTGPKRSTIDKIKIDEFLIGLALANVLAFAIQDFVILLMYKVVGLKGQSLLSATVIAFLALIALYVYLYLAPEGFNVL